MYICVLEVMYICVLEVMYICVLGVMYICVLEVMYMCVRGHVYMCVRGIDLASFYIFSIRFWRSSDSMVFFGFHFIIQDIA